MLLRVDTISSCCLRVRGPKVILFLFYFRKLPGVSPEFQSALVIRPVRVIMWPRLSIHEIVFTGVACAESRCGALATAGGGGATTAAPAALRCWVRAVNAGGFMSVRVTWTPGETSKIVRLPD
jgi:hypothetical protein